jgi:Ca-activated chloride channel homolog
MNGLQTVDGKPIPLRAVDVSGDVIGGTARIKVRQRYENVETKPIEAIYVFPLPTEATLSGFVMECNGRRIEGVCKEREEAFRAYDDATLEGHGAALLEQERANVFTATVGNLLPGETTIIECEYVQRLHASEGSLRVMIPTLVAPRYIPGAPQGDRTGHGVGNPTDRVPDADRISPKIGKPDYTFGLALDLHVGDAAIESPSHSIVVQRQGSVARVTLTNMPLDRDVVILAEGTEKAPVQAIVAHRAGDVGTFAISRLVDLFDASLHGGKPEPLDVVFVIDRSGSMGGTSIEEARKALRLCMRQLREGDRFSIIAFDDQQEVFAKVPFTQKTLENADRFIASIDARGGTELLAPLTAAVADASAGVVVLLTDGQVGNEDEILAAVMAARKSTRIYTFGIGTNVSDALLSQLARRTGGAVEFIHPGERIDDKVVTVFSRAIAPRVTNVKVKLIGVEADELAPTELSDLIDGEAWSLFGRYRTPGRGRVEVRGTLRNEAFLLELPIELPEAADNLSVEKLWAAERVRDLESIEVEGRRKQTMKDRIVAIATAHGVASRYTSFLAIETRSGDRRVPGAPEARPVPVHAPAGWAMFEPQVSTRSGGYAPMAMPMRAMPPPMPGMAGPMAPMAAAPASFSAGPPPGAAPKGSIFTRAMHAITGRPADVGGFGGSDGAAEEDPVFAILSRQLANGLFDENGDLVAGTTRALIELLKHGVDASHALHGELVKKAIAALVALSIDKARAEHVLSVAWVAASGKRTRKIVVDAAQRMGVDLSAKTANESGLRAQVLA